MSIDPKDIIINSLICTVQDMRQELEALKQQSCTCNEIAKVATEEMATPPATAPRKRQRPEEHNVLWVWNGHNPDDRPEPKALYDLFSRYGAVEHVFLPKNASFCKVWMETHEGSASAIRNLNGTVWGGHKLRVDRYKGSVPHFE